MVWGHGLKAWRPKTVAVAVFISIAALGLARAQSFYWHRDPQFSGDGEVGKAFNWTSNRDGTGFRPKSTLDDDFADTLLAPWAFHDSVMDGFSKYSFTQNPGKLTLIGRGVDFWLSNAKFDCLYRSDIQGNFDVTVKVESQTTKADKWTKSGIMVANNVKNLPQGGLCILATTVRNGIAFQVDSSGLGATNKNWQTGYDSTLAVQYPVWLRLVKNGGAVSAFYKRSLDSNWIQVGKTFSPPGTAANSQIGLFNVSHDTATSDTVVFDDFEGGGNLQASNLDLSFDGTGATHDVNATLAADLTVSSLDFGKYAGAFSFGASTLTVSGNASFSPSMSVAPGTGTLSLSADSGKQTLTPPKSGVTGVLPALIKTGKGTLSLEGPMSAVGLAISAGVFDFNGNDVALKGNLNVTKGMPGTFVNLGGRSVTAGSASFAGSSGSLLGLNPTAGWSIKTSGALTADYAILAHSAATGSHGTPSATCVDSGGNSQWDFNNTPACDSTITVSADTVVDEGQTANLVGKAKCTTAFSWSVVSGPAPRILDPEVSVLSIKAPRLAGDTILVYRFTADYGSSQKSKDVKVSVREAIPDPDFAIPANTDWNGTTPLILRPTVTNAPALQAASYHPPIQFLWTLSGNMPDTSQAGDSLTLSNPKQNGSVDVGLCLTNGGAMTCHVTTVNVVKPAVFLRERDLIRFGPVKLIGSKMIWEAPRRVRIRDARGRVIWEHAGKAGTAAEVPQANLRALLEHRALLEVSP